MVLLPTNEFFDDACSSTANTACGAYLKAKLPNHEEQFRNYVATKLALLEKVGRFEKDNGKIEDSYGAGTCLYVEDPPGLSHSIMLAAATTKRAGVGFQANPAHIYQCIEKMAIIATDQRIATIYLPLLGAGKGALTPSASLMATLLAISTLQRRLGGFDAIVTVVVFKQSPDAEPVIDAKSVKRILSLTEAIHRIH